MDIKKTKTADLEHRRTTWFLLGLILVLAVIFVVFEYTDRDTESDKDDGSLLEDLPREDDRIPLLLPGKGISMAEARQEHTPAPEKIKVVTDATSTQLQEEPAVNSDKQNEGAAHGQEQPAGSETSDRQEPQSPVITDVKENPHNFHIVENFPQFPGGPVEFMKWLTRNLHYPLAAERQKIEGEVLVQFIVNTDGSVSDLKVVKPLHPYCDREAMRVLRTMPQWTPGMQNDKPCRTMVCIPIIFKL